MWRPRIVIALIALAATTMPAAVLADPPEAGRIEARRALEEGAKRFDAGDYAAALASFEEAYRHYPSPRFFYNIGQANRQLARDVEALEAFERFLKEAPDAPASARGEAERSVAELRARVGTVEVTADAPAAEVALDGRSCGTTPATGALGPIRVAPGPHQIVVEKAGHEPFLDRFEVGPGMTVRVRARLSRRSEPPARSEAAPVPEVRATVPPGEANRALGLGHGGQLGVFLRSDVAVTLPGFVLLPGLSYGVHDRLEVLAGAIVAHYKGGWLGARTFLGAGSWKPTLMLGVPVISANGTALVGVQGGAGVQWDPARSWGLFLDLSGAFYPRASSDLGRFWLLPIAGVQARL